MRRFCFSTRHDTRGRVRRDVPHLEYGQRRNSFLRGNAQGRRPSHVLLYVARGNRMRCRLNRDSVLDTLHVQPPVHHSIVSVFPRDAPRTEGPL
jgi:hypothetical protein